jgi:hypothetical protein
MSRSVFSLATAHGRSRYTVRPGLLMKTTSLLLLGVLVVLTQPADAQGSVAGAGECFPSCGSTSSNTMPSQSSNNSNARKIQAIQAIQHNLNNNQQLINNAGDAILSILSQSHVDSRNAGTDADADSDSADDDAPTATPDTPPQIYPSADKLPGNYQPQPPPIDYEQRARAAAAAQLVADDVQDSSEAAQAISQQIVAAQTAADDNASATSAVAQQLAKQDPIPTGVTPRDLEMFSVFTESADDAASDQEKGSWLAQTAQRVERQFADGLDQAISRGGNLLSRVANDPVVQWVWQDQGTLTTAPAPSAADSPEMAADKVIGQGALNTVGAASCFGGPLLCAKALYGGGIKLVNQISTDVGLAVAPIQSDTE